MARRVSGGPMTVFGWCAWGDYHDGCPGSVDSEWGKRDCSCECHKK